MADDQSDQSQKTEEPTQRKLSEARKKGEIASSREVNNWFMILGAALMLMIFGPSTAHELAGGFRHFIEMSDQISADGMVQAAASLVIASGRALLLPILLLVVAALGGGLVQSGFIFTAERLAPNLERISPIGGVKRLFSLRSLAEFVKGLLKISIVGVVAGLLLLPQLSDIERLVGMAPIDAFDELYRLVLRLLVGVVAVMTVIAALDYAYQRFEFIKKMRMTRQELKDEFKQSEGDPLIKGRIRQIRMERARKRMMAAVPEAAVVVTNPTHYAVALKYDRETMDAPVVVAKGIDFLALRIREIADEHDIPRVENRALAQALYVGVEIGHTIPPEHFRAVAEIIGYVLRLKAGDRRPYRPSAAQ